MSFVKSCFTALVLLMLVACDDLKDNFNPSSDDLRPVIDAGSDGSSVSQAAPDFTIPDTLGNLTTMSTELSGADGIVLYFTMWCPICDSHMSHMRANIIPNYPTVKFYFVDYVSGSISVSRSAQISNGYTGSNYTVLVDTVQTVLGLYKGTMGTTIVIDRNGIVSMNEDYKDGVRLNTALSELP